MSTKSDKTLAEKLRIVQLRLEGKTFREISEIIKKSKQTVCKVLKVFAIPNEYKKVIAEDTSEENSIEFISDQDILTLASYRFYGMSNENIAAVMKINMIQLYKCYKKIGEKQSASPLFSNKKFVEARNTYFPAIMDWCVENRMSIGDLATLANIGEVRTIEMVLAGNRFMSRDLAERISLATGIPIGEFMSSVLYRNPKTLRMLNSAQDAYAKEQAGEA